MLTYIRISTLFLLARARTVKERTNGDRGASAIEWAIIAAISVVLAVAIGGVIYTLVNNKKDQITKCDNAPVGAQNC